MANAFKGRDEEGIWSEKRIWDEYIEILHESPVQAFGITDYFSCDNYFKLIQKYKQKHPNSTKVFFPNIELRYSEAISKKETNPDVHVIFDNDENDENICSRILIEKFLSKLPVLANCIREAKKHRQVILVTHNPNLAVGADAEQIVYINLNKSKNYQFTYDSGSIENPRINEKIVVVLEGTQPAFVKRRLKYQI